MNNSRIFSKNCIQNLKTALQLLVSRTVNNNRNEYLIYKWEFAPHNGGAATGTQHRVIFEKKKLALSSFSYRKSETSNWKIYF